MLETKRSLSADTGCWVIRSVHFQPSYAADATDTLMPYSLFQVVSDGVERIACDIDKVKIFFMLFDIPSEKHASSYLLNLGIRVTRQ